MTKDDKDSLLASCTDLANSWAREWGVTETYNEAGLKVLISELWDKAANEWLKRRIAETRLDWAINNGWLLIPAPCGCCYGPASIDDIDKAMKAQELEENL